MNSNNQIFNYKEDRTTEAAGYFLKLHGGKMEYIKLIKLLYLVDRESLKRWERPVTYDDYYSMKNGQVLSKTLDIVKENLPAEYWNKNIRKSSKYIVELISDHVTFIKLTKAEVKLIEEIYQTFGSWSWSKLAKYTHNLPEYEEPKPIDSHVPTPINKLLTILEFNEKDIERITNNLFECETLEKYIEA